MGALQFFRGIILRFRRLPTRCGFPCPREVSKVRSSLLSSCLRGAFPRADRGGFPKFSSLRGTRYYILRRRSLPFLLRTMESLCGPSRFNVISSRGGFPKRSSTRVRLERCPFIPMPIFSYSGPSLRSTRCVTSLLPRLPLLVFLALLS